ncbi:PREDICTED: upstream stimulatory factor 1 isoform X2 [Hipposideros armiger]|uniref:Upstream stimulatory factor 1 isoform X2 n=1 Tax=Hipposideros armiger TaxID=186990 RepID=A0A8B7QIP4_HIPAR|nr:PREDICTED: upstream stimulatory factor 1 isoform X2 [Hipposideros armiger]XP_019488650.1 PREDICTED: upstream stimulatory factor 1 isoform X2 [Hipposideros armiger]XP_019488651.1 PREDICTED: upstream stimulatory factor 1 isoform X2 [Hipposideros armiger]XP_019488652.1 PREDICTED: upstream stimulatory factor 1 isoform X2 [Hipposideros armiger]
MKGQQKTAETEEGTVQIQEGAVATGEDPTSVAIASIQSAATFPDPNVKYVFRTENGGQVMYRVIQVSEGQLDGQTEGSGAISGYPATQSMTQAVIQGAFTSDDGVDTEGTAAETHYTYFPSTAVGDGAAGTTSGSTAAVVTTQGSEALLGQATPPGTGQFFVMMSPQEVLQGGGQRSIAPRTHPYSPLPWAPLSGSQKLPGRLGMRNAELSIMKWSAAAETRSITGLCSCPRSSPTAPWRAPSLARAKVGFYPKPVITSRSFGRVTTGCLKSCRGLTSCSWTTTCFDSRWKILKTRTCCCEPSCGTTEWRWSSRVTATSCRPRGLWALQPRAQDCRQANLGPFPSPPTSGTDGTGTGLGEFRGECAQAL